MTPPRPVRARGFTGLELLITLGVMAALVTVISAGVGAARIRAHDAAALVCARDLRGAEAAYYSDRAQFSNYAAVGPVASCAAVLNGTMTAPHWIDDSPTAGTTYRFTVKHPRGRKTFVVTETTLTADGQELGVSAAASAPPPTALHITSAACSGAGGLWSSSAGCYVPNGTAQAACTAATDYWSAAQNACYTRPPAPVAWTIMYHLDSCVIRSYSGWWRPEGVMTYDIKIGSSRNYGGGSVTGTLVDSAVTPRPSTCTPAIGNQMARDEIDVRLSNSGRPPANPSGWIPFSTSVNYMPEANVGDPTYVQVP